ncbi:MAG: hypothetical protein V1833_04840 [Elusimicrobiota bacterium]
MCWNEISKRIDNEIKVGTKIPKTDGKNRTVTKKVGTRIYIRTGINTHAEKYTTKEMIQYAYDTIKSGKSFTSAVLKSKFPQEYKQGSCVFSMTGGILAVLGLAKYTRKRGYTSVNNKDGGK